MAMPRVLTFSQIVPLAWRVEANFLARGTIIYRIIGHAASDTTLEPPIISTRLCALCRYVRPARLYVWGTMLFAGGPELQSTGNKERSLWPT